MGWEGGECEAELEPVGRGLHPFLRLVELEMRFGGQQGADGGKP